MKSVAGKLIAILFLLLFTIYIPLASAQAVQYQIEPLNISQTGGGIEITTNKITFTTTCIGCQVSLRINCSWTDEMGYPMFRNFYITTPPTNNSGITSLIFQDVIRRDTDTGEEMPVIIADLSSLGIQQELQTPLGCCKTIYSGCGSIEPFSLDEPIAICKEAITTPENQYTCEVGRMINSGIDPSSSNTGAWTNFTQPCETANAPTVRPLICGDGNPNPVSINTGMGTTNGMTDAVFANFKSCWWNQSAHGTKPWKIKLPVISCPDNSISNCSNVLDAVTVNILWVNGGSDSLVDPGLPHSFYPTTMGGTPDYGNWTSPDPTHAIPSWNSFVWHFHLRDVTGATAPYQKRAIYFLPDCNLPDPPNCNHEPVNSCFSGYTTSNYSSCALLDSIYKSEGIGEVVWDSNYSCNQQTLLSVVRICR